MTGWTERLWIGLLAAPLCAAVPGCLKDPGFACESNAVCFLDGVSGQCDLASAKCVYLTDGCAETGGYRDGEGNCVSAPNSGPEVTTNGPPGTSGPTSSGPPTTGDSASSQPVDDDSDDDSDSATTRTTVDESTSSDAGTDTMIDPSAEGSTSGGSGCESQLESITAQGLVVASSTFTGYDAELSIDGDLSTSWFSTGPEGGGAPSVYTWTTQVEVCISRVFVADNAQHANPDFREDYGFATGVVRVFNQANDIVWQEEYDLNGSDPDGDITADTGGVIGNRVVLEFNGHESPDCGGFSEVQVLGGLL